MSILIGLNSAIRSIKTHNYAIDTVSHNIANMNNPEYSKQAANITSTLPMENPAGAGHIGTGSHVKSIYRIRDVYLDRQIRSELSDLGKWTELSSVYNQLKAFFPEIEDPTFPGIQTQMEELWKAWGDLAAKVDSGGPTVSEKSAVLGKAQTVAQLINQRASNLTGLQVDINAEIRGRISEMNSLSHQVYELNKGIVTAYGRGQNPNDLLDKRTEALAGMSELANITIGKRNDGSVVVHIHGHTLVNGVDGYNKMTSIGGKKDSKFEGIGLYEHPSTANPVDITENIRNGRIGGLLSARDETVHSFRMQLDMMASSIITATNKVYNAGDHTKSFFTGNTAATMLVNSQIANGNDIVAEKSFGTGKLNIADVLANMDNKLMGDWIVSAGPVITGGGSATLDTPLSDIASGTGIGTLVINGVTVNYDTNDTLGEFINKLNAVDPDSFMAVYDESTRNVFMMMSEYTTIKEADGMELISGNTNPFTGLKLAHQKISAGPVNYPHANEGLISNVETWAEAENKFDITPYDPGKTDSGLPGGVVVIRQGTTYYDSPGARWETSQRIQTPSWAVPVIPATLLEIAHHTTPHLQTRFDEGSQKIIFNSYREDTAADVYEVLPLEMSDKEGNFTRISKFAGNVRFENYYDSMLQTLESEQENADIIRQEYELAVSQLQQMQENITEINEDEELAKARAYQRAYDASVKLLSIIDQMLNMLINRTATPSDSWDS